MSAEIKYWYLKDHKLFKNLSFEEIDTLCILNRFKKTSKNQIVDLPHGDKERIFILKQGTIKLVKINDAGEEILIDILQKGDLFGELNLEKPTDRDEFFKVVSDEAIMCTFFKEKLEEVMYKKPEFALNYIKFLGLSFKKIQNGYKNILFKDTRTRVLLLLNMIIEKENVKVNNVSLPNYLTQKDIAQLICATRQTVNTILNDLEKEGIIQYTQKRIVVPDVTTLKKLIANVK